MGICEHCGSHVPFAKVCPKCGRDHDSDWIKKQTKQNRELALFSIVGIVLGLIIGMVI